MNSVPSDFTLHKGKVIHQYNDDHLPIIGKFPDTVRVYLWLVYHPDGILASWDRHKIDATCYDMVVNGIPHEFFSHVITMSFESFKSKFPNVPVPDQDFESQQKYTFKK